MAAAAAAATTRVLVYEGPFGPQLARLKKVSILSMGCTLVGVPLLAVFGNEGMEPVQRGALHLVGCLAGWLRGRIPLSNLGRRL
jgi:hypothetical protein